MARLLDLLRSAGWPEFVLLLAVAAVCGGTLIFVGVTDLVGEDELHATAHTVTPTTATRRFT